MNHESVTNRANDNAYLKVMEDIDWDVFYEQKMALQDVTDYLHRHKEQENGMFDRAAAWMEGIITLMDSMGDAAEDMGHFVYPERDENDLNLYINWYPKVCDGERKLKMYISYCNNSTADEDFELDVVLAEDQYEAILRRFEAQFEEVYTSTIEESWKQFLIDSEVEDYGETEEE